MVEFRRRVHEQPTACQVHGDVPFPVLRDGRQHPRGAHGWQDGRPAQFQDIIVFVT